MRFPLNICPRELQRLARSVLLAVLCTADVAPHPLRAAALSDAPAVAMRGYVGLS